MKANKYPSVPQYNIERGISHVTCCWDCAQRLGWDQHMSSGVCTSYEAECEGCGEVKICTQPRDFNLSEESVLALRMEREAKG